MSNHGVLTPIYYGKFPAAASDRGTGRLRASFYQFRETKLAESTEVGLFSTRHYA
jgi:hypothetical protein